MARGETRGDVRHSRNSIRRAALVFADLIVLDAKRVKSARTFLTTPEDAYGLFVLALSFLQSDADESIRQSAEAICEKCIDSVLDNYIAFGKLRSVQTLEKMRKANQTNVGLFDQIDEAIAWIKAAK